jgi:hypothetical protein
MIELMVKVKDREQNITHTVRGVGATKREAKLNALKQAKKLLGTDNLDLL